MLVDAYRKRYVGVPESLTDRLDLHAGLETGAVRSTPHPSGPINDRTEAVVVAITNPSDMSGLLATCQTRDKGLPVSPFGAWGIFRTIIHRHSVVMNSTDAPSTGR